MKWVANPVKSSASFVGRFIAVLGLIWAGSLALPESARAQNQWDSLSGWFISPPDTTSDHYDGLSDRPIPAGARYCWVAEISDNWIGVVYRPEGTFFGILYWTMVGYDVRTSLNHSVQKNSSSNKTEISVTLWNDNRSGSIRFRRVSTGTVKTVPFQYGPCPSGRIDL